MIRQFLSSGLLVLLAACASNASDEASPQSQATSPATLVDVAHRMNAFASAPPPDGECPFALGPGTEIWESNLDFLDLNGAELVGSFERSAPAVRCVASQELVSVEFMITRNAEGDSDLIVEEERYADSGILACLASRTLDGWKYVVLISPRADSCSQAGLAAESLVTDLPRAILEP